MIRHSSSTLGQTESEAVARCLQDNFVGPGPASKALETAIAQGTSRGHVFTVSSGFHALGLALHALNLPRGSAVGIPVLTCMSVHSAVVRAGYRPVLCDIDPDSLALAVDRIPAACLAVVAPHAYGFPVDVDALASLGILWIEDCATSPASTVGGRACGSFGSLAIFSFNSTKYVTGGSGGAVVTNDELQAARIAALLDIETRVSDNLWTENRPTGWPGRMADLNAAVAFSQWQRLPEFLERRREIAAVYRAQFEAVAGELTPLADDEGHSYYRFCMRTRATGDSWSRRLQETGVDARSQINPWLDEYFETDGASFPGADSIRHHLLSLPIHPTMDAQAVKAVMEAVKKQG